MANEFDKASERRKSPRTKLEEIAYIGMGPENGGLILDVSDGGLSFHSVVPLKPADSVRFLLSVRGQNRIEGAGEVVWTNEMQTICGLKFTSLSSGAREHLNNWTTQSRMPVPAERAPYTTSRMKIFPRLDEEPITVERAPTIEAQIASGQVFAIPPEDKVFQAEPESVTQPFWQARGFRWMFVSVLVVTLAITAFRYGVHVGKSQIHPAAVGAANAASLPEPPAQQAAQPSAPMATAEAPGAAENTSPATNAALAPGAANPSATSASAAGSIPNVDASAPKAALLNASKSEDATPAKMAPAPADKRAPTVADPKIQEETGKLELATALALLNGENGKRDSSKAAQHLWAAVKNGNSEAAVLLSDLYVTGDGVEKSCQQGLVLLKSAMKNGNSTARAKLDDLNTNGCQ